VRCRIVVARHVVGARGTADGRRIVVARGVVRAHATIGGCSDVGARCYVPRCYVPPTFSDTNRQNTRSEMQNVGRYLVYATPDHTDYRRYPLPDFLLV